MEATATQMYNLIRGRFRVGLEGAKGSETGLVALQALVYNNGHVAGASGHLTLGPVRGRGKRRAQRSVQPCDGAIIDSDKADSRG